MLSAISVTHSEPGRPSWAEIVTTALGTTKVEAVRDEGGFSGQLTLRNLGYLRVAHVNLNGAAVRGMRRRSAHSPQAFSWLAASVGGGFELSYGSRSVVMEPGRMTILDPSRTYVTTFAPSSEVLWARIPQALLKPCFTGSAQVVIDGTIGAGRLAFDTLKSIAKHADHLSPEQGRPVADGLLSMITAASLDFVRNPAVETNGPARTLQRVKAFILENLSDDSLSPDSVAAANGLAARYINKLFEREGSSLMRWVWRQRLDAARATLARTPLDSHSVGSVAYTYGFKTAAHFSHAFRRQFGYPPRAEKRVRAEQGV